MTNLPTLGKLPPLPSNIDIDALVQDILAKVDPTADRDLFTKAYWLGAVARVQREQLAAHRARWRAVEQRDAKSIAGIIEASDRTWINPHSAYVYLLWGTGRERPLCAAGSQNVMARLGEYMRSPERANRIRRIQLLGCQNRVRMLSLERRLVEHYQPPWNHLGIE